MKRPCEGNGRDWRVVTSQRISRISSCHQKIGESHRTDSPSEPLEQTNLQSPLFQILSSRTVGEGISIVSRHKACGNLLPRLSPW